MIKVKTLALLGLTLCGGCTRHGSTYKVISFVQYEPVPTGNPFDIPLGSEPGGCRIVVENTIDRVYARSEYNCGSIELGMEAGVFGNEVIVTKGGHFWVTKAETKGNQ
jgi:hypothetical protein